MRDTAGYGRDCALLAFAQAPPCATRDGRKALLAPHRVGRAESKPHDGTIVTHKVNEMWGTDMTQTITVAEGRAYVFVAVEHANSEVVGIHAARSASRMSQNRAAVHYNWHRLHASLKAKTPISRPGLSDEAPQLA